MQKIDNIEIKNFKSIRHQKIEGCKRVNVFIGYPNVGKSNILEALSFYSLSKMDIRLVTDIVRLEATPNIFFNGSIDSAASIKLNDIVEMTISYSRAGKAIGECGEIVESNKGTHSIFHFIINKDLSVSHPISNLEYDFTDATLIEGKIVKYSFKKEALAKPSDNLIVLDSPYGENLYSLIQHNNELKNDVKDLLKEYSFSLIFDQASQQTKALKKLSEENSFIISFDLLADTLLRLIFYKAAILSNKESILLFEEPEAHMFPPYISKFTSDLIHDENNNQFFITTHSPFVLNDLMDSLKSDELAIYIVSYKKETGETQVNRMSEEDMHEAYQFGYDFFMNIDKFISQEQHDEV